MVTSAFREAKAVGDLLTLRRLHGIIENRALEHKEQLYDLLQAVFVGGLLDRNKLASDMGYNISSISRWIDGVTSPHKAMWPILISWIMENIDQKIDEIESIKNHENLIGVRTV